MEWFIKLIRKSPFHALLMPFFLGGFNFIVNLINTLQDANIENTDIHQLLSSTSGLQAILLIIIMAALKKRKNDDHKT